jgi:hypothetical protein
MPPPGRRDMLRDASTRTLGLEQQAAMLGNTSARLNPAALAPPPPPPPPPGSQMGAPGGATYSSREQRYDGQGPAVMGSLGGQGGPAWEVDRAAGVVSGTPPPGATPRFVRREGDVGYFEPEGGGDARAVHLPSAPTFAAMAAQAERAPAPMGGPGASAPVADLGLALPVQAGAPSMADWTRAPARQAPAVVPPPAQAHAPGPARTPQPLTRTPLDYNARPTPRAGGPAPTLMPQAQRPAVDLSQFERQPQRTGFENFTAPAPGQPVVANPGNYNPAIAHAPGPANVAPDVAPRLRAPSQAMQGAARTGQALASSPEFMGRAGSEDDGVALDAQGNPILDAQGNPIGAGMTAEQGSQQFAAELGAPIAPARPGAPAPALPTGVRRRAPGAAPAQEPDLIDALTNRPRDDAPLFGEDFRQLSPLERQQQLINDDETLQRERAYQGQVVAAEQQDALDDAARRAGDLERERQGAMRAAQQRYTAAQQRMRDSQVDPNRYFADRGGALGRIGAAIATALGAAGSVLTGGPNMALGIIEGEIDRDIEAQRANQALAQSDAEGARTFLDITRTEFSDRGAAEDAARAMAWDAVARRAAQHEALLTDQEARNRANALRLQAEQESAAAAAAAQEAEYRREMELRLLQANTRKAEAEAMREERRARGGGSNPVAQLERRARAAHALQEAGGDQAASLAAVGLGDLTTAAPEDETAAYRIPGATFLGETEPSAEDVRAARGIVGGTTDVTAALDEMIRLREEYGPEVANRDVVASMMTNRDAVINALRVIEQTGVPSEAEMADFRRRVPDAASFTNFDVLPMLRALRGAIQRRAESWLRPVGYAYGEGRILETPEGVRSREVAQ